jgi:hypothetical protein
VVRKASAPRRVVRRVVRVVWRVAAYCRRGSEGCRVSVALAELGVSVVWF